MDDESEKMNEESAVISVCGYLYDVPLVGLIYLWENK